MLCGLISDEAMHVLPFSSLVSGQRLLVLVQLVAPENS